MIIGWAQIYSAIITYCVVAIAEKESQLKISTYDVLRILSVGLLDKKPFRELFEKTEVGCQIDTQLNLNFFSGHVWVWNPPLRCRYPLTANLHLQVHFFLSLAYWFIISYYWTHLQFSPDPLPIRIDRTFHLLMQDQDADQIRQCHQGNRHTWKGPDDSRISEGG